LKTRIEDDIFRIKGSPIHLTKLVMNLISNAAEAMVDGGDLNISVSNCYIDKAKKLYDGIINEGNYVLLRIQDCGVGISPKNLSKIFEPFYTKKVMGRSGTGLGMAVVWGTVKDHHGHIHMISEEGSGTVFEVYLPITGEEINRQYKDKKIEDFMGRGECILVVDDIQEQREIAGTLLGTLGYSVDQVPSGEEAIEYIKTKSVDLVLLDMIMEPGLDGLDTFKRIREINPDQKTVIVSGYSETERIKEALLLGAGKYLKKPYTLEKIGVTLRLVLDSGNG
jgi:two-component system cell cycle sensor histidine kinase/response regulator CckA